MGKDIISKHHTPQGTGLKLDRMCKTPYYACMHWIYLSIYLSISNIFVKLQCCFNYCCQANKIKIKYNYHAKLHQKQQNLIQVLD